MRAEEADADVIVCRSVAFDDRTGRREPLRDALRNVDFRKVYSEVDLSDRIFQFCVGWPRGCRTGMRFFKSCFSGMQVG